ncbi:ABC transporter permease [Lysinibacter cavernae]|uniref:Putative ABC transport system permease protein n=1 Tax=Lysinibacter cavernae TaxID=1640652 RepID=A0A7X5R440_9MICO|nr:ABC transporter permease [Lysinibacter cavernae]NIH54059.1 putative ABC transport system permease protein [Lysinibacter cavernae]NIH55261.1 putative ABC transport system permease protein [Lysinibacter cavernae]
MTTTPASPDTPGSVDDLFDEALGLEALRLETESDAAQDASTPKRSIPVPRFFRRSSKTSNGKSKPPRNSFTRRDLINEAIQGVGARPSRLVLTLLGTVLGILSLVVTVGLAQTAANQINRQFDAVAATQVVVTPAKATNGGGEKKATGRLPWDAPLRVDSLAGVEASALVSKVDPGTNLITAAEIYDPAASQEVQPGIVASTAELMDVVHGTLQTGRFFDSGHEAREDRVVVLGKNTAEQLGINRVDSQPSIFIGDRSYTVIGIIDDVKRRSDLLDAVVLPVSTARTYLGLAGLDELQIRIAVGAGEVVGKQAPIALDPNRPEAFAVAAPQNSTDLQESVQADIDVIFLVLGGIALLAGGLGIANVTLLSVMERVGEIGLRRALGATRKQIAAQFVLESVTTGLLGGLIGAALGTFTVVVISVMQEWAPVLDIWVPIGGAALGGIVGLIAGTYPALKASRIEPITALRGGV